MSPEHHLTLCAPRGEGYQGQSPWLVRGTEGSNPSCSSGESANFRSLARSIRLHDSGNSVERPAANNRAAAAPRSFSRIRRWPSRRPGSLPSPLLSTAPATPNAPAPSNRLLAMLIHPSAALRGCQKSPWWIFAFYLPAWNQIQGKAGGLLFEAGGNHKRMVAERRYT
jgi:hypothetical protein